MKSEEGVKPHTPEITKTTNYFNANNYYNFSEGVMQNKVVILFLKQFTCNERSISLQCPESFCKRTNLRIFTVKESTLQKMKKITNNSN